MKRILCLCGLLAFVLVAGVSCKQEKKNNAPSPAEGTPEIDTLRTETYVEAKTLEMNKRYHVEYGLSVEYVVDERLDPVVRDSMNCAIAQALFGQRNPLVEDLAIAKEADVREWFQDGIWEEDEDVDWEMMMTDGDWQLSGEFSDTAPEGYINYNIAGSQYMFGAAHGYYYFVPIVIDLSTGCRLRQEQLFNEEYFEEGLSQLLFYYLQQDEYYEEDMLLFDEPIKPNNNFTLSKDGITYYFNPYEIAAYAYGLIAISVPAADLKTLLNPEYAHLWGE